MGCCVIKREDLKLEPYEAFAGTKGGMSVGRLTAGVKVTHLPTGTMAACTSERQQYKNSEKAVEAIEWMLS